VAVSFPPRGYALASRPAGAGPRAWWIWQWTRYFASEKNRNGVTGRPHPGEIGTLGFLAFDPLAQNWLSIRYFLVPMFLLLALAAYRLGEWLKKGGRRATLGFTALCTLLAASLASRTLPVSTMTVRQLSRPSLSANQVLARELAAQGLKYGYATYWHAGAPTVLSDFAVRVNPVQLLPTGLGPFPVLISERWYDPANWKGVTFLALNKREATTKRKALLRAALGRPARELHARGFEILVFEHNIAQNMGTPRRDASRSSAQ
jgi:hypothetical protein